MIDEAIEELTPIVGTTAACAAVGRPRQTHYRWHRRSPVPPRPERVAVLQPRALNEVQRKQVLTVLHCDEHVDEAPATVYAKLLDQGIYLASTSTMYRILRANDEVRERRRQATHPAATKPELLATQAQRDLLLGHHQAARPTEVDLLLPLRDHRHLQPLRARLDARPSRTRTPRGTAVGRHHRQAARRPRPAHRPCRPGPCTTIWPSCRAPLRPSCRQLAGSSTPIRSGGAADTASELAAPATLLRRSNATPLTGTTRPLV